jgi:hypothetical protein
MAASRHDDVAMAENLSESLADSTRRHRSELIDLASLWVAALLCEWSVMSTELPPRAILCALLIADVVPARQERPGQGALGSFVRNLPHFLVASVGIGLIWRLAWGLPPASLFFAPFWLGLSWLARVGGPGLWQAIVRYDLRQPGASVRSVILEWCVVGAAFYLAGAFYPNFWPSRFLAVAAWMAWPTLRFATIAIAGRHGNRAEWLRLSVNSLIFSAGLATILRAYAQVPLACLLTVLFWTAAATFGARAVWRAIVTRLVRPEMEGLRWIVLALAGLWLMRGYATFNLYGAGDAQWYGTMLKDVVTQVRSGVFPLWLGQSASQFNGAIYPLRIAPGFHYLGVLLDAVSFRTLGVFALQNLLLQAIALTSLFICYAALVALAPKRRWLAAGLAVLFLACPGVVGMAYKNDLLMSWVTLPAVVLAWYATVQSFREGGKTPTMLILGVSLGLCWWGHSPIALWMTLIAALSQVVRLCAARSWVPAWIPLLVGAGSFIAVAAFPVGSVLFYPPEPGLRVDAFQQATATSIAYFVNEVFPAILLPLSSDGGALSDLQLGYSLWAVLGLVSLIFVRRRLPETGTCLAAAFFLLFLLLPIPGLNAALWSWIPQFIRNATSNWAMNRLYLPLAGAVVFGAGSLLSTTYFEERRKRLIIGLVVGIGCAWSLAQASDFHRPPYSVPAEPGTGDVLVRPENAVLTRFAYFIFPHPPDNFTHGTADPMMENRLLARDTLAPVAGDYEAAKAGARTLAEGVFVPKPIGTVLYFNLNAALRIEPGQRYLLDFRFPQGGETHGILEAFGKGFYRKYGLPEYGGARSFGAGGDHSSLLSVWTTQSQPVDLHLRFYPEGASWTALPIKVRFLQYDSTALPVAVKSLIPFRAQVRSVSNAWLETPRMHQAGYVAVANGRPAEVRRSSDGLALIAIPKGDSMVELVFKPPLGLQALFWFSLAAIGFAAVGAVLAGGRVLRAFSG